MEGKAAKADVDRVAAAIRRRVLLHTIENNGGYLCQACGSAETLATLYLRVMHPGPSVGPLIPREFDGVPGPGRPAGSGGAYNGERGPDNDRFLLSCTHYSLGLYATLIEVGRLDVHALDHYDRDGSTVEQIGAEHSPGIEVTTGSLAQALSVGLGMAFARRLRGDRGRVWVYMSDGELQEGQTWEVAFSCRAPRSRSPRRLPRCERWPVRWSYSHGAGDRTNRRARQFLRLEGARGRWSRFGRARRSCV